MDALDRIHNKGHGEKNAMNVEASRRDPFRDVRPHPSPPLRGTKTSRYLSVYSGAMNQGL